MSEQDYMRGSKSAYRNIMLTCLGHLKADHEVRLARCIAERDEAITVLRQICKVHGDNDWEDELHLADIIDKHLGRHLG